MKLSKHFNKTLVIILVVTICICGSLGSTVGSLFKEFKQVLNNDNLVNELSTVNMTILDSTSNNSIKKSRYYINPTKNILGELSDTQDDIELYNSNVRSIDNQVIDGGILEDNLSFSSTMINGKNIAEERFMDGYLTFVQYGDFYLDNKFDEDEITVNINGENSYLYKYNEKGRITEKYADGQLIESYEYNDNREIKRVTDHTKKFAYEVIFDGDKVSSILQYLYRNGTYIKMKYIKFEDYSGNLDQAEYNNTVNDTSYLTSKVSGNRRYDYNYLNNIVISQTITYLDTNDSVDISYMFDAGLNRIGFIYDGQIYYYIYDIQGNIIKIINDAGKEVLQYNYDIIGKATVSGESLDLAYLNSFAFRAKDNWIFDFELQQYYETNNTYSAKCGVDVRGNILTAFSKDTVNKTIKNGVVHTIKPSLEYVSSIYDEIENIISNQSCKVLAKNGFETYTNALSVDEEELVLGKRVDIVALPKERSSFNTPISFELVNTSDSNNALRMNEIRQLSSLNICVNLNGEYYEPGSAQFGVKGHFVLDNKYVKYTALPNTKGIISYNIVSYDNTQIDKSLGNLYNYDLNQYVYFVNPVTPNEEFVTVKSVFEKIDYDSLRNEINEQLRSSAEEPMTVNDMTVTYISEEYIRDIINNSSEPTYIGGRTWDEMVRDFGTDCDMVYYDGQLQLKKDVPQESLYGTDWEKIIKDVAIGTGVIIIGAAVTAVTGGGGFACFAVAAATMAGSSLLSGTVCATIKGAQTGDWSNFGEDLAEGYKYTAIILSTAQTVAALQGVTFLPFACFTGGTPVTVPNGIKNIENIQVGDYVESYNFDRKQVESKKVTNVFKKEKNTLVELMLNNEIIETTPEHPFYVEGIGWVKAEDLLVGVKVKTYDGESITIDSKTIKQLETPVFVYNFEVEDNHNYFVGNSSVLVHNTCGAEAVVSNPGVLKGLETAFKYITSIGAAIKVGDKLIDSGDLVYNGTIVYQDKAKPWTDSIALELEKEIEEKKNNNDNRIYYRIEPIKYNIKSVYLGKSYTLQEAAAMMRSAPINFVTLYEDDAAELIRVAFGCFAFKCRCNNVIDHYHPSFKENHIDKEHQDQIYYDDPKFNNESGYSLHSYYLISN